MRASQSHGCLLDLFGKFLENDNTNLFTDRAVGSSKPLHDSSFKIHETLDGKNTGHRFIKRASRKFRVNKVQALKRARNVPEGEENSLHAVGHCLLADLVEGKRPGCKGQAFAGGFAAATVLILPQVCSQRSCKIFQNAVRCFKASTADGYPGGRREEENHSEEIRAQGWWSNVLRGQWLSCIFFIWARPTCARPHTVRKLPSDSTSDPPRPTAFVCRREVGFGEVSTLLSLVV